MQDAIGAVEVYRGGAWREECRETTEARSMQQPASERREVTGEEPIR